MDKIIVITIMLFFVLSCKHNNNEAYINEPEVDSGSVTTLAFSRKYYLNPNLGAGASFSSLDYPVAPQFKNARFSYNIFTSEYADDLTYWLANNASNATVNLMPGIDTPFGNKSVSHVQMINASGVNLMVSYSSQDAALVDLTNRDFEYSIWFFNNNAVPSRVTIKLQNRVPVNGVSTTLCVLPPKQWVRCSGRLHTGSVIADALEFLVKERQFALNDGDVDMYVSNASLIDITGQLSQGLLSPNATTANIKPQSYQISAYKNNRARKIISIGDSIYASPASGVANQQAHSTALGVENLGGYIDARAVGGWSVSDMLADLVVGNPLTLDETLNALPIISPGSNDALNDSLAVPVQKEIVDNIVKLFTDVGNNNYLVLGVHGNSVTKSDLDTTVSYNALLSESYGEHFLDTWQKLKEISDQTDQNSGIISQRYRQPGSGLHLSEEGKMHIVRWSIERLKSLGYINRVGTKISEPISYQHTINDSLSYPVSNFDENAFTVIIKWSPGKSQTDLTGNNGVLSVNGDIASLVYVNSSGVHSLGGALPVTVDPAFEAGLTYTIAIHGSINGSYQIGVLGSKWLWSTENVFTSYESGSFIEFCLSTEMTQNFALFEIYSDDKTTAWIEAHYQ